MTAYYNENDPFAANWLRNLISKNLILKGDVDERSITEVKPDDLKNYTQHHFFAGIGGWSYALRLAGWDDSNPIWTGSPPCQPFSSAGKRKGIEDERHLWPYFFNLIKECHPEIVLGEQVASKDGLTWLDTVSSDMEGADYAFGAVDLCAASVGAPHIRQRLFFVGVENSKLSSCQRQRQHGREGLSEQEAVRSTRTSVVNELDTSETYSGMLFGRQSDSTCRSSNTYGNEQWQGRGLHGQDTARPQSRPVASGCSQPVNPSPGPVNGFWHDADWLYGRDNKWRPVESGTFPLANGISKRVGRLRGYGNAINPILASKFIESVKETISV